MKRFLIRTTIFLLLLLCFKGHLYRLLVTYREIDQRASVKIDNPAIRRDLDTWSAAHTQASLEEMVDFAGDYATHQVRYTLGKCSIDPNKIILGEKKTNCIGYSASFQAVLVYLLEQRKLTKEIKCTHKVGHLYLLGYNLHQCFDDPAFKDHDYNVVTDTRTGQQIVLDPTVWAHLGIGRVTGR
jgi:hypothetical protein